MKNKGLIIGIVIVLFVIIIIVAIILSRKKTDAEKAAEYQAQMMLLQQQGNQNLPQGQKDSILDQIARLSGMIVQIKQGGTPGSSSGSGSGSANLLTWQKVPGAIGICGNPANLNKTLVLKNGSHSPEVCALQSYLNAKNGSGLVIDGAFGPLTQSALKNLTGMSSASLSQVIV